VFEKTIQGLRIDGLNYSPLEINVKFYTMTNLRQYWPVIGILVSGIIITSTYAYVETVNARRHWQQVFDAHARERVEVIRSVFSGRHEQVQNVIKSLDETNESDEGSRRRYPYVNDFALNQPDLCRIKAGIDTESCSELFNGAMERSMFRNVPDSKGITQTYLLPGVNELGVTDSLDVIEINVLGSLRRAINNLSPDGVAVIVETQEPQNTYHLTDRVVNLTLSKADYTETIEQNKRSWKISFFATLKYPHDYPIKLEILLYGGLLTGMMALYSYLMSRQVFRFRHLSDLNQNNARLLTEINRVADIGYWERDLLNNTIFWSDQVYQIFDLAGSTLKITYDFFLSRVHPDDREKVDKQIQAALTDKQPYEVVCRILDEAGNVKYLLEKASVQCNEGGEPLRLIGTVQDISRFMTLQDSLRQAKSELEYLVTVKTQQLQHTNQQLEQQIRDKTQVEKKLLKERNRARQYLDIVDVIILVLDVDGNIVLINKRGLTLLGYDKAELIGKNWFKYCLTARVSQGLRGKFAAGILHDEAFPSFHENQVKTKTGSLRTIAWHNVMLRDERGDIIGTLSSGSDITESKISQELLNQNRQALDAFYESGLIGVINLSSEGKIQAVNNYICELTGFRRDELKEQKLDKLLADADGVPQWLEGKSGKEVKASFSQALKTHDGRIVYVDVLIKFVTDITGLPQHIVCLLIDATEKTNESRRMLEREKEHRKALVREIHHRIKNHLQGVIGLLQNSAYEYPKMMQNIIEKSIVQINALAVTYGLQSQYDNGEIFLCDLVKSSVEFNQKITQVPREKMQLSLPKDKPFLLGDEQAVPISLIVNELLLNAIKHGNLDGQPITVDLIENDNGNAVLKIVNPDCSLPDYFDFKQESGLGTGLELVKALMPEQCELVINNDNNAVKTVLHLAIPAKPRK
jgi:two-component system, sensor histidine kinase PdtaS